MHDKKTVVGALLISPFVLTIFSLLDARFLNWDFEPAGFAAILVFTFFPISVLFGILIAVFYLYQGFKCKNFSYFLIALLALSPTFILVVDATGLIPI